MSARAAGIAAVLALAACSPAAAAAPTRHLVLGATGSPGLTVMNVDRDGGLSVVPGYPILTGVGSFGLVISPDGKTVYSGHTASSTIVGYRLGDDGSLTPIPGALVVTGGTVVGLAITPDGSRMFVAAGYGPFGQVLSYGIAPSGALTPTGIAPTPIPGLSTLSQPSITPNGRHLIVSSFTGSSLASFVIEPDSRLTPVGPDAQPGLRPTMPVLTPDGRHMYISNEGTNDVSGFTVGSDGTLTATPGSPYPSGNVPHGEAITPDSQRLYVPASSDDAVHGFRIGTDGSLTPLPGSPYPTPGNAGRVLLSPDARRLFLFEVTGKQGTSRVFPAVVNADGSLTFTGASADSGLVLTDGAVAYLTPNQGPIAMLQPVASGRGLTRTFSAAGSSDPDGSVATYRWDFGDGEHTTTTTPQATHRYRRAGTRSVTVTVTDDEGCSTELISNGMAVECNGGPRALASRNVTV